MKVIYTSGAEKTLKKLDKHRAGQILSYMDEIEKLENPFSRGHGLVENKSGYWRYCYQSWRILCQIKEELIILVVEIGKRDSIYRVP